MENYIQLCLWFIRLTWEQMQSIVSAKLVTCWLWSTRDLADFELLKFLINVLTKHWSHPCNRLEDTCFDMMSKNLAILSSSTNNGGCFIR